ncbi:Kinesin-like protein KIN12B [Acorus calamus]|uniref:Kinesin-like protein KIN12B n=1 Tax=Acorus calamus TaxID=4465 RepID=A0AAV9F1G6_ACOCL|nr:Kinesin-like protein KIN12B [Acorus calamus]
MSTHKRIISRSRPTDASENEFKALSDLIPHPPSRPPLNTIQVPSRNPTEIFDETANNGGGSRPNTPKSGRGKTPSESGSAQSTPARVVSRVYSGGSAIRRPPPYFRGGTGSKAQREVGIANCGASIEVSHFELNEDPSFWRDHNVQVLIRIRPINSTESSLQEHSRCLKQESSQTLMWTGHPETRFTFDHVACETISQEKLFEVAGLPMVENCMSGYNSCMFAYGQEEESRKDEKLKYSCKCSFLEIYNEQITDLLEPSSTNLQLREDLKKGVYVENLMEHEVATVKDVLEILIRGTANRKIAATHMNSESSRSHSVFTCVIESQWEKDSMTHLRYGRLNLVDLAGSERQKSSGAEGERLKEAANINKSLSTLGLVIMTLVDVAHGKQRHIPYRDSRLTFLLQDSLGGNSKTTIIANVSPSICSANETLSTLKFAQRAKLIQNNAKVNEDASGNVIALQQQIQQLKEQLTLLVNHQNIAMSPSCQFPMFEQATMCSFQRDNDSTYGSDLDDSHSSFLNQKIKNLEAILIGALRREKKMETSVRRLETEIEHTNHLVCQREDDAQRIKDLLWTHEEKTKQLKMLTDGLVSGDSFLKEENDALLQEIQLLQARINGNPELTRLSLENMRLNEELKMFQEFYQLGERDTLLAEISELRQQDDIKAEQTKDIAEQVDGTQKELDVCKKSLDACLEANVKLNREIDDLRLQLRKFLDHEEDMYVTCNVDIESEATNSDHEIAFPRKQDRLVHLRSDQERDETVYLQLIKTQKELKDAQAIIKYLEVQQVHLIGENNFMQDNHHPMELQSSEDFDDNYSERHRRTISMFHLDAEQNLECGDIAGSALYAHLEKMQKDLDEARMLNKQCWYDYTTQLPFPNGTRDNLEKKEKEAVETVHCSQEMSVSLSQQAEIRSPSSLPRKLHLMFEEKWEKATIDLTSFLSDGCQSLEEASDQIEIIIKSFPQMALIDEHIKRAVQVFIGNEKIIADLQNKLENAQKMGCEMKKQLSSLKEATLVFSDVQQLENDENTKELLQLRALLREKGSIICDLESKLKCKEDQNVETNTKALEDMMLQTEINIRRVLNSENSTFGTNEDAKNYLSFLKSDLLENSSSVTESGVGLVDDVHRVTTKSIELNEQNRKFSSEAVGPPLFKAHELNKCDDQPTVMQLIRDELAETSGRLDTLKNRLDNLLSLHGRFSEGNQYLHPKRDSEIVLQDHEMEDSRQTLNNTNPNEALVQYLRKELESSVNRLMKMHLKLGVLVDGKEIALNTWAPGSSFHESVVAETNEASSSNQLLMSIDQVHQKFEPRVEEADADCCNSTEILSCQLSNARFVTEEKMKHADRLLLKFEEAQETMKEADVVLTTLLDVNMRAKRNRDVWKRASEVLEAEKASLLEVVQSLQITILQQEKESEILQELTSNAKDKKDETLGLVNALSQVRQELDHKTSQVDDILVQQRQLQIQLTDKEAEFNMVKSDLERANSTIDMLADENNELRHLLEDLYVAKRDLNENLEEKQIVIEGLEKEILCLSSSVEEKLFSTVEGIEDEMRKVSHEKDNLRDELVSLNAKLDMAKTLADENEAIAIEARQVAEASKLYAEQKEEEVKILERSIEELEYTIDVLEKKVHEMGNEVKRHQLMRRDLELELQTLQQRMAMIESAEDAVVEHSQDGERGQMHERCINLDQAKQCIKDLKIEKAKLAEEIKKYKDHIFELVLHSEAQASQFQQKVCALTARLATVESMTHDVIRDLLGVKMDMTNYANLIDHQQLQRALAQQATEESDAKENENLKLKKKIEELIEERERLKKEISKNKASILATQVKVEQLQQRDQLLTAQNEMLKMDKANLNRKIADMDVMAQKPSTSRSNQSQVGTTMRQSENHLSHEKEEIARNFRTSDKAPFVRFSQGKRLHETLHVSA